MTRLELSTPELKTLLLNKDIAKEGAVFDSLHNKPEHLGVETCRLSKELDKSVGSWNARLEQWKALRAKVAEDRLGYDDDIAKCQTIEDTEHWTQTIANERRQLFTDYQALLVNKRALLEQIDLEMTPQEQSAKAELDAAMLTVASTITTEGASEARVQRYTRLAPIVCAKRKAFATIAKERSAIRRAMHYSADDNSTLTVFRNRSLAPRI